MKKKQTLFLVYSALIAALYASLTLINPLSFGQLQFRVSEVLTVLAALHPAAIVGLSVGCLISNLASFLPLDMIFGTAATLLSAVFAWLLRKITYKGIPVLSCFMPVIFNAVIIGAELCVYAGDFSAPTFLLSALYIAISETVLCAAGLSFFPLFQKLHNKFFTK